MLDFRVHSVGRYVNVAVTSGSELLQHAAITFHVAGQSRLRVGKVDLTDPGPYLALFPAGVLLEYEFSERTDWWAIIMSFPGLQTGSQPGAIDILDADGSRVTLPMITPIVRERISGFEGEFLRIREAFHLPLPTQRMRVHVGVCNIIRYIIDQRRDVCHKPVAKLRWLIDEDQQACRSLEELSRQCGYSASRLRTLFEQEYAISPLAYRNKRRMSIAADLLCNSDLRIKEISDRLGCRHVSHFCSLFKTTFGLTPSEYQRQFRR